MTFQPSIFYLTYWISPKQSVSYLSYCNLSLLSCSIVQGALFTKERIPQENRRAMEEQCRIMQNSIIEYLPSAFNSNDGSSAIIYAVGRAMQSVYTALTMSRSMFGDEAEFCKCNLRKSLSLLGLISLTNANLV